MERNVTSGKDFRKNVVRGLVTIVATAILTPLTVVGYLPNTKQIHEVFAGNVPRN